MTLYRPFDLEEQAEVEKEKRVREQIKANEFITDMQFVMGDPRGRRLMWWILSLSAVGRNPFTGSNNETNFRAGMMNVGQALFDELKTHCFDLFIEMERERKNGNRDSDAGSKQQ